MMSCSQDEESVVSPFMYTPVPLPLVQNELLELAAQQDSASDLAHRPFPFALSLCRTHGHGRQGSAQFLAQASVKLGQQHTVLASAACAVVGLAAVGGVHEQRLDAAAGAAGWKEVDPNTCVLQLLVAWLSS